MKCPKCGAEMVKAKRADVWLCEECGARARISVDEPDGEKAPTIFPLYPPQPPVTQWTQPVWYGPSPLPDYWPQDSRRWWWTQTTADSSDWPPGTPFRVSVF